MFIQIRKVTDLICPRSCNTTHCPDLQEPSFLLLPALKAASSVPDLISLGAPSALQSPCRNHALCQPVNQQLGNLTPTEKRVETQASRSQMCKNMTPVHWTEHIPLSPLNQKDNHRKKTAPQARTHPPLPGRAREEARALPGSGAGCAQLTGSPKLHTLPGRSSLGKALPPAGPSAPRAVTSRAGIALQAPGGLL